MGKTVALTDGTMHTEEATTEQNVTKIATKQHKDKNYISKGKIYTKTTL
jgi:hypothetical protein